MTGPLPGMENIAAAVIEDPTVPATADHLRDLDPVDILHVRDHRFVKRGAGGRKNPGCGYVYPSGEMCGAGKARMVHHGAPPSLNAQGSSANMHAYQTAKKAWQQRLMELLEAAGLPKGLGHVYVEGQACFPDRARRDQGNYRFLVEKALGDALVAGGWLADDAWEFYEFGRLRYAYAKGQSWTALTIFPRAVGNSAILPGD